MAWGSLGGYVSGLLGSGGFSGGSLTGPSETASSGGTDFGGIAGGGLSAFMSPGVGNIGFSELQPMDVNYGLAAERRRDELGLPAGAASLSQRTAIQDNAFAPPTPSGAQQRTGLGRLLESDKTGQPMWRY